MTREGEHDLNSVFPTQVGNQNILDLKNQVGIEKEKYFYKHCLSQAGGKPTDGI